MKQGMSKLTSRKRMLAVISASFLLGLTTILFANAMGRGGYLTYDIAKVIFPNLIQVNATLIGFWGIMFVYYLKNLQDTRRYLLQTMMDIIHKVEELVRKELEKDSLKDSEKKMLDTWKEHCTDVEELIAGVDKALRDFMFIGVIALLPFLLSILLCILSLGKVDDVGIRNLWVGYSLVPFFVGVMCIFFSIWYITPDIPEKPQLPKVD